MRKASGRNQDYGKFRHLYRSNRWKQLSLRQRQKEPLCRMCKARGRITLGTVCDHVDGHPANETEAKFWAGPFQTLCAECHSGDKARIEAGGQQRGCGTDGWPIARNDG
jgi:hypothetical protein